MVLTLICGALSDVIILGPTNLQDIGNVPNIIPWGPPIPEMPMLRCPEKAKQRGKEYQCTKIKGHFGPHQFESKYYE